MPNHPSRLGDRVTSATGKKAVDDYIEQAPEGARKKLREVRSAILQAAPEARESISYRIPYYDYKGRLAWYGLYRNHVSLFVRPPVIQDHRRELEGYATTKSAVHLPLDKPTPVALVKKLVRARVKMNDEEAAGRTRD